jgi:3-oxoacyl-[acyl-carrier protein] reductase
MPVAIVTGTRKGLGKYIAQKLLTAGWLVVGCGRRPCDWTAPGYTHHELDAGDEAAVVKLVRETANVHGRIDALINNAGIAGMNHLLLTPKATVDKVFNTNFLGSFLFLREAAKIMVRQKSGRIVNFTTVAAAWDLEGEAVYAASKAAVESLTRVAARELGESGITVNAIGPTPVATDLIKLVPADKIESLVRRQAIRRMGTEEDVWNVVDFYLRPESGFVTGQIIYLGGVRG